MYNYVQIFYKHFTRMLWENETSYSGQIWNSDKSMDKYCLPTLENLLMISTLN